MFLWKDFFDGMDQENSKTQGGKGTDQEKILKTRRKEWTKEKKRDFSIHGVFP
jgi:hypothetical protein